MIDKCRVLYKGDMIAGIVYIIVGLFLLMFAFILHIFTISPGYLYLSYGFFMFFLYCTGKGIVMYIMYSQKYNHYKNTDSLSPLMIKEEQNYTNYRIQKKNTNRRRYIWILIISCIISFTGIFLSQKSLLMGTAIPIALISGIELCIGLLTEFRLREYQRILKKTH